MKKITLSIASIILALTCIFGLTACDNSTEEKIQTYIESDTFKKQIDSITSQYESMLDIDFRAEGSKLIMGFTYKTQITDERLGTVKSALDSTFDFMASTFEGVANSIKKEVGVENPVVVIEFNNADGKNITSIEFNATE